MEEKNTTIPYFAHESMMARAERTIKRLWVLCIILIALCAVSNYAWLRYEQSFEDVSTTITQDVDSGSYGDAIINDGVHINGESEANSNDQT